MCFPAIILNSLKTTDSLAPLIARLVAGAVMLPHGLQKTLGSFGGYGLEATLELFTGTLGLPWIVALLVIAAESLGALALILGFMTRFSALCLSLVMLGAILIGHWDNGFFMNWSGKQAGEGFEYHILYIGLCLSLVVDGAGRFSIDRFIQGRKIAAA